MGALNRFRHLPAVQRGEAMYGLRMVASYEIIIIIFACVIAGFLAYTSPPERGRDAARAASSSSEGVD